MQTTYNVRFYYADFSELEDFFSKLITSTSAGSHCTLSHSSGFSHFAASCSLRTSSPLSTWHQPFRTGSIEVNLRTQAHLSRNLTNSLAELFKTVGVQERLTSSNHYLVVIPSVNNGNLINVELPVAAHHASIMAVSRYQKT